MIFARLLTSECLRSNSMHQILKLEIIYRPNVLTMTKTLNLRMYLQEIFICSCCNVFYYFFHCCKYIVGSVAEDTQNAQNIFLNMQESISSFIKYMIQIHCGTCSDRHFKYIHPCQGLDSWRIVNLAVLCYCFLSRSGWYSFRPFGSLGCSYVSTGLKGGNIIIQTFYHT